MSDLNTRCLEAFGTWLANLADDTRLVADAVENEELPVEVRCPLAAGLNYLFKSLDLIDDGIEGIGFLDDALVLRAAAVRAGANAPEAIKRLAGENELVAEFLDDLNPRFTRFVQGLDAGSVHGRSVAAVVTESAVRDDLLGDVRGWASRYSRPNFAADEKHLVKLRSFLAAKLPA